jgi:tRNA modification GTPase
MGASTIAAIATPPGSGGIGIIKISGPRAIAIASQLFRKSHGRKGNGGSPHYRSHHLYHGTIVDPDTGTAVDEVLLSVMKGPRSYTREDVVEINSHSGGLLLQRILRLVIEQGAEPAAPGEFTLRAFNSGRIDLTQAEAIADLINARSESALNVAAAQLGGELGQKIDVLRENITHALSLMYACMDFGDENDLEDPTREGVILLREKVLPEVKKLLRLYETRRYLRTGIRVVIAGKPNVGKSTLMNRMVGRERAIVTSFPGTTRDLIDHQFSINGIPVILVDTAGIRKSDDPVERIGIQRARGAVGDADLVLALFDGSQPASEEDFELLDMVKKDGPSILVINKDDKLKGRAIMDLGDTAEGLPAIRVSALYEKNLEALKDKIFEMVLGDQNINAGSRVIPNMRQAEALKMTRQAVERALSSSEKTQWVETIVQELEAALNFLGEITGSVRTEEVLERVFSNFCIGK